MDERAEGFSDFVAEHALDLLRLAHLLGSRYHDSEDMVQGALERVYRHWDRVRHDDPLAYARRAVVNAATDHWRRRARSREDLVNIDPEVATPDTAAGLALRHSLLAELRRLPQQQRTVLVLRYWQDMSERDVAELLGCSLGTVKSHASRGLDRLRKRADREAGRDARTGGHHGYGH